MESVEGKLAISIRRERLLSRKISSCTRCGFIKRGLNSYCHLSGGDGGCVEGVVSLLNGVPVAVAWKLPFSFPIARMRGGNGMDDFLFLMLIARTVWT